MNIMCQELTRLVDDYNKCDVFIVKEQILCDINLLTEALIISDQDNGLFKDLIKFGENV